MRPHLKPATIAKLKEIGDLTGLEPNEVIAILVGRYSNEFLAWWSGGQSNGATAPPPTYIPSPPAPRPFPIRPHEEIEDQPLETAPALAPPPLTF